MTDLQIKIYNDNGEFVLNGGKNRDALFKITDIDGIGLVQKKYTTAEYANSDGQETLNERAAARTITIKIDACEKEGFGRVLSDVLKILSKKCTLEISNGLDKRQIEGRCSDFVRGENHGIYKTYVMQFICDYPYFSDIYDSRVSIFDRINLITPSFTLPGVFTRRISDADAAYRGEADFAPVFEIEITDPGQSEGIVIENRSNGDKITLEYVGSAGEKITVDTKDGIVFNDSGDDLTEYLSNDTFLEDFRLHPGENRIFASMDSDTTALKVKCIYKNIYGEAMFF